MVVQWLRLCLPMQGVWVQSLVRERKSHVPRSQKMETLKEKQKQYCNKFTKYFKMVHIKKKIISQSRWDPSMGQQRL